MTTRPMKEFDNDQCFGLRFLKKQRACLHFPFFANTFSLAYHYAACLHSPPNLLTWRAAKGFLFEHNWEQPIPPLISGRTNVFYATKKAFEDLQKEDSTREKPIWQLVGVPFTRYRPRYSFADFRACLSEQTLPLKQNQQFPDNLARLILNERIHYLEILTDIPSQSVVIIKHMKQKDIKDIVLLENPTDALRPIDPGHKVLRLYFYGAPTTTKMLGDPIRFIPYEIPDKVVWNEPTTITQICLAMPYGDHEG